MTRSELIKRYISKDLWSSAETFTIPEKYLTNQSELIEMVLRSKSIDTHEEKQNWFNLMPLMNTEQLEKLRAILHKEKQKLQEIEDKYDQKKKEIKKKYLMKWQEMGYVKKVSEIKEKESLQQAQDEAEANELLDLI